MLRCKKKNRFDNVIGQISIVRIVILFAFGGVGAWFSFAITVAGVNRTKNPEAVLMLVSTESNALAARADQLYLANPAKPSPQVGKLAHEALKQQALNAKAVRLLGYLSDLRGDKQQALLMVEMAAKLSRREAGAQLWLLEHHAKANDTAKTLSHYDVLLTTKPEIQALLYSRLAGAIDDGPVRSALLPYMRQDRGWATGFLNHAIGNNKDLSGLVSLIIDAKGFPKNDSAQVLAVNLIGRLTSEKRYDDSQRIYRLMPGAKVARLTNPAFDDSDREAQYGAMGWQISDDPNASGGFAGKVGQGKPALSVFANSATTQVVASRLLYLQPGTTYRFSAKLSQLERGDGGYIRFQLRCPTSEMASPIWVFDIDPKRPTSPLDIALDCPVQYLDIVASGGKGQLGMEATISSVAILQQTGG